MFYCFVTNLWPVTLADSLTVQIFFSRRKQTFTFQLHLLDAYAILYLCDMYLYHLFLGV